MSLYQRVIILSLFLLAQGYLCAAEDCNPTPYHDWDYLMFSQRWPITSCSEWEESKPDHKCNLPDDKSLWTIHGIWPTKLGTEGPLCCPSAIHFDPQQLTPIMSDLNLQWANVEGNTKPDSFWKHEWVKHGTCASTLPVLDSVLNYFKMGLVLNKKFELYNILEQAKIVPNSNGYKIEQIYGALKSYLKVDLEVQCIIDKKSKKSLISEIRICTNKSLELIDCPSKKSQGINSNCNSKKQVMYLDQVPSKELTYEIDYMDDAFKQHFEEQMLYVNIYRFLKFLLWFTT